MRPKFNKPPVAAPARLLLLGAFAAMGLIACGPEYPTCETDGHCESHNEVCVDTVCRACRSDAQCNAVDPCMACSGANVCERRQGCCQSDLDCPDGRCWRSGDTVGSCGGECQESDHCPEGQRCSGQRCVPDRACTDDAVCEDGERCIDGQCSSATCDLVIVQFDFNEYAIRLDQEETLASNASCMKERMSAFRVEGHCDERGSDEYNLALGQRRAGAVARQYKTLGVDRKLVSTISYGEEHPACSDLNLESCWRENRRVETVQR